MESSNQIINTHIKITKEKNFWRLKKFFLIFENGSSNIQDYSVS